MKMKKQSHKNHIEEERRTSESSPTQDKKSKKKKKKYVFLPNVARLWWKAFKTLPTQPAHICEGLAVENEWFVLFEYFQNITWPVSLFGW